MYSTVLAFSEEDRTYIELSSCNPDYYNTFLKLTKNYELTPRPPKTAT